MKRAPFLALLLCASIARAASTDLDQAKTFFAAGASAYSKGRYEEAVSQFEEAYRLAPKPQVLFSLAQAERKLFYASGRPQALLRRTLEHYDQYVKNPAATRREDATAAIQELLLLVQKDGQATASQATGADMTKCKMTVQVYADGARIALDDHAFVDAPMIVETTPGKHRVRVTAEGYRDAAQDIVCEAGTSVAREVPMTEKPATLVIDTPRSADVYMDGKLVGRTTDSGKLEVPAGTYVLALAANGAPLFTEQVTLTRGAATVVHARLHNSVQRTLSYIAFVSSGLFLVSSGVLGLGALSSERQAKDLLSAREKSPWTPDELRSYERRVEQRDNLGGYAAVALGVGVTLGAIGALTYALDKPTPSLQRPQGEPSKAPKRLDTEFSLAPLVSPTTQGLQMAGVF